MNRKTCISHAHKAKDLRRATLLVDSGDCSFCKYYNKPATLADLARDLEGMAYIFRHSYENPDYDPHGFAITGDIEKFLKKFLRSVSPEYRASFLENIKS